MTPSLPTPLRERKSPHSGLTTALRDNGLPCCEHRLRTNRVCVPRRVRAPSQRAGARARCAGRRRWAARASGSLPHACSPPPRLRAALLRIVQEMAPKTTTAAAKPTGPKYSDLVKEVRLARRTRGARRSPHRSTSARTSAHALAPRAIARANARRRCLRSRSATAPRCTRSRSGSRRTTQRRRTRPRSRWRSRRGLPRARCSRSRPRTSCRLRRRSRSRRRSP